MDKNIAYQYITDNCSDDESDFARLIIKEAFTIDEIPGLSLSESCKALCDNDYLYMMWVTLRVCCTLKGNELTVRNLGDCSSTTIFNIKTEANDAKCFIFDLLRR